MITATAALPAVMLVVVLFELSMLGRVLLRRCFRAWIDVEMMAVQKCDRSEMDAREDAR